MKAILEMKSAKWVKENCILLGDFYIPTCYDGWLCLKLWSGGMEYYLVGKTLIGECQILNRSCTMDDSTFRANDFYIPNWLIKSVQWLPEEQ